MQALHKTVWRGSLLPLGREATPFPTTRCIRHTGGSGIATAAPSSGSKLPRHRYRSRTRRTPSG
ncbi:hypothetical protein C1Y11_07145 [Pseudomonas sp. FW305-20]|nr:hypothetical protein C1Y11_07145 [Pseudomonas sp. FW305-20]PMU13554.1 hypothetical protein C1Y10_27815 [Pseudomonas sp. FW305-122]PMU34280.1 hypothetical protein C1Y12_27910 [Pseudomonas sp. FW305-47B]PMX56545.1 hypothetical protein C1Y13_27680 [Pseudomonas sp. FW305-33]PMX59707.1 hypothetical protein C1X12_27530 [Pseudomonas sp. FW305-60]